uniref:Cap-specific mRNA (nucleoside-2'-O-)-methyltransferase 1 n=3 Tax=Parascaris univalens TaxID=6257 RepID=A0A914ZFD5_PARUN
MRSSSSTNNNTTHERRRHKKKGLTGRLSSRHVENIREDNRNSFNETILRGSSSRRETERLTDSDEEESTTKNDDPISRLASQRLEDIRENFNEELSETVFGDRRRNYSERLSDSDEEEDVATKMMKLDSESMEGQQQQEQKPWQPKSDDRGAALLAKMGYGGGGLGKSGQGRTEPIPLSTQRGRIGLGHQANQSLGRDLTTTWDSSLEEKSVEESVSWVAVSEERRCEIIDEISDNWIIVGKRKEIIDDEEQYCDGKLLRAMLQAKSVFDDLNDRELREARSRANPYETIGSAFFQNRAAMKVANLDRIYDWLLTKENSANLETKNPVEVSRLPNGTVTAKEGVNTDRKEPLFYFADVCAGPGGFTEYVLWRKGFYNAKGFGFTLAGKDDFKLERFMAASPEYFEPYYGKHGDGDVMKPDNIISLEEVVMKGTNNVGVDLMMADGGFSVEGKENIQEILSKRLYLCQFLVALSIVRPASASRAGGVFFCKLFDIFTPFSVGLVYLMYIAFKRISLHKPNTSRPANSERYIICDGLTEEGATKVKDYLTAVNNKLDELEKNKTTNKDVNEVIPSSVIHSDDLFMDYLVTHNERMVKRQTQYLDKYRSFAKNVGQIDTDQAKLREDCLHYWRVPDVPKRRLFDESLEASIGRLCKQVVDFEQLRRRTPPFNESILESDNESRIRFAELRMCALTEKEQPTLLFSVRMGIFIRSQNSMSGFEKLDIAPRIPKDTVLFVHKTTAYSKLSEQGKPEDPRSVIRIVDAAVINGDDVSSLPYDERMEAAEKMCLAVNCVHEHAMPSAAAVMTTNSKKRRARSMAPANPVLTAKVFKLDELGNEAERFSVIRWRGEELAVIKEGSSKFICRGMRIISILADPWVMCWSRSQKKPYAFDKSGKNNAVFSEHFVEKHCCSSFWRTIVSRKATATKPSENYQWHWDWAQDFLDGHGYGPRPILGEDEHQGGPTWRSVYRVANQQKERICHVV